MTAFPSGIYDPRTKENKAGISYDAGKTTIGYAEDITKLDDEVVAIETELGTDPKGSFGSVKLRLEGLVPYTGAINDLNLGANDLIISTGKLSAPALHTTGPTLTFGCQYGAEPKTLVWERENGSATLRPDVGTEWNLGDGGHPWSNLWLSGNLYDGVAAVVTVAQLKIAYDHSQDNSQAHTDYLINNGDDTTSGKITMANLALSESSSKIEFGDGGTTDLLEAEGKGTLAVQFKITSSQFANEMKLSLMSAMASWSATQQLNFSSDNGGLKFQATTAGKNIHLYSPNIYVQGNLGVGMSDPHSKLEVDGAISSKTRTLAVTGPTDGLDVGDCNTLFINAGGNNVVIGGFAGGVNGQKLDVVIIDGTNTVTLEHNEGGGYQDIFLHAGADESLTGEYGGWTLVCNGSDWYDVSHARHV